MSLMGLLKCRARREQSQYLLGARLLILSRQFWSVPTDAFSPQSGLFSAHRCARGSLAGARDWGRPQVFLSAALGLSPSGQSDLLGLWGSFLFSEPSSALFQALCPPQSSKTLRASPGPVHWLCPVRLSALDTVPGPSPDELARGWDDPLTGAVNHAYFIST